MEKFEFTGSPLSTYEEQIRPAIVALISWIWAQR